MTICRLTTIVSLKSRAGLAILGRKKSICEFARDEAKGAGGFKTWVDLFVSSFLKDKRCCQARFARTPFLPFTFSRRVLEGMIDQKQTKKNRLFKPPKQINISTKPLVNTAESGYISKLSSCCSGKKIPTNDLKSSLRAT